MSNALVYSKPMCPFCVQAKRLLLQNGAIITEIDGMVYPDLMAADLAKEENPTKTFPQIWLDGKYIGGYDQLRTFYATIL